MLAPISSFLNETMMVPPLLVKYAVKNRFLLAIFDCQCQRSGKCCGCKKLAQQPEGDRDCNGVVRSIRVFVSCDPWSAQNLQSRVRDDVRQCRLAQTDAGVWRESVRRGDRSRVVIQSRRYAVGARRCDGRTVGDRRDPDSDIRGGDRRAAGHRARRRRAENRGCFDVIARVVRIAQAKLNLSAGRRRRCAGREISKRDARASYAVGRICDDLSLAADGK